MISVIVPIFNVDIYLPKCIDSIIYQSYPDLEIILVDDGSLDRCPEICDDYANKDNRIKVIHKSNGGLSNARNAGLEIATGEYISFIDSDDYIAEHMYKDMLSAIENVDADLCICGYDRVNNIGEVKTSAQYKNAILSQDQAFEMLVQGNVYFIISCNKLYRKEIFDSLRFKEGKTHEDEFIMHHVYGKCKKIVTLEKSYYYYFVRESSITGSVKGNLNYFDSVDAYIDRMDYFFNSERKVLATKMLVVTIYQYFNVKRVVGKQNKAKEYSVHVRKIIIELGKKMDLSVIHLSERVGIQLFSLNERSYLIWDSLLNTIRKIKG